MKTEDFPAVLAAREIVLQQLEKYKELMKPEVYTDSQKRKRKIIANVLRAAKPFLFTEIGIYGRTKFICHAVGHTKYSEKTKQSVEKIICDRLGETNGGAHYHHVGSWLHNVVGVPLRQLTFENVQNFRHRWLDSLVKEFS